jgi:GR25 family glycosyltransferase involved in LPS biosynthesis
MTLFARFINLKDRPERIPVMNEFVKHTRSCALQRFDAIRIPTRELAITHVTPRARADMLGRMRMHHESLNTVGAASCYLSHITVLREFLESECSVALILEDDLKVEDSRRLDALIHEFVDDKGREKGFWDVALLGWGRRLHRHADGRAKIFPSTPNFAYGSHAYMVTRKAADTLLKYGYPMEMQWDSAIQAISDMYGMRVVPTTQPHLLQSNLFLSDVFSSCPLCEPYYVLIYIGIALLLGFILAMVAQQYV